MARSLSSLYGGSTGEFKAISTTTVSVAVASVDFTLPSGYMAYKLVWRSSPSDSQDLRLRFSNDGGSTFIASSYAWSGARFSNVDTAYDGTTSSSSISLMALAEISGVTNGGMGEALILGARDSSDHSLVRTTSMRVIGSSVFPCAVCGKLAVAENHDAIRLFYSTGTITKGVFTLYGLKEAA